MLRLLCLTAAALTLAACGGSEPRAEVQDLRLQKRGGAFPTLSGYVVNRGDAPISSADVFVTLYNEDNQIIEDKMVPVRNVGVGDSTRFELRLDLPAAGAKLKFLGVN